MLKYGWKVIVLVIVGALLFLWLIKAPIMASYLTGKLKVPVSVSRISTWPSQTNITNFRIKNPRGFKTETAFKADKTKIHYQFSQLIGNPSVIDRIDINDIFLSVEFSNPLGTQNNWTAIGAKMGKSSGHEVVIHKLVLTNLTVEIRGLGLTGAPQTKTIDRIELNEIDSAQGFPTKQLISQIFKGAGLQQYIKDAFDPQNMMDKALSPFKGLGTENEKGLSEESPLGL
jgi:hypothetical protein